MKEKAILLISLAVGLLAAVLMHRYLAAERARLYQGVEKVPIVVAARDLPAETVLKYSDLGQRTEFKTAVGDNVIKPEEFPLILDRRLRYPVRKNEPIFWSHVEAAARRPTGLAPMIRTGMRAVSIAVSGPDAVSGLVQPNDRVDILGTFSLPSRSVPGEMETVTLTVLQDVTVLACGAYLARSDQPSGTDPFRPGGYNMVTLAVTPREAELLTFIQHMRGLGQLTLSLRNPEDVSFEKELPEINFRRLESVLPELNLYRQRQIHRKPNL